MLDQILRKKIHISDTGFVKAYGKVKL